MESNSTEFRFKTSYVDYTEHEKINISYWETNSSVLYGRTPVQTFPLLHLRWTNEPEAPYGVHILIGLIALILGSAGLVGNIMVIYLFTRNRQLRRSANLFVLNLAMCDTLLIVTNVPLLVASSFHSKWLGGVVGCRLFAFCGGLAGFVSINTLTVLSIERCVVITCHIPNTNRMSNRGAVCVCFLIWMYSFLWSLPPYLGWGGHMMEGSRTSCTFDYFTRTINNRSYVVSILLFCFIFQLFIIVVAYLKIAHSVFESQKEIAHYQNQSDDEKFTLRVASKKRHQVEWRTAKTVLSLVTIFCLSWTPYAIVSVIGQFGDQSYVTPLSSAIPGIFAKMSSFLNPIFYTLIHSKYRKLIINKCNSSKKRTEITTRNETKDTSNSESDEKQYKINLTPTLNFSRSTVV